YLVAGTVGGILANATRPAEFIYDNMMIHATVVHAASTFAVAKLLYLGSSCIYPREAPQPMAEAALLTGPLEPTNLYGPNDNFDLNASHVVPGLIRKFHEAKQSGAGAVTIWGSGAPRREL